VRNTGSGNIGATNLYRTVGRKVGILTLIGDCLKGMIPVLLVSYAGFSFEYAAWVGWRRFWGMSTRCFLSSKEAKG
jgi:glycerol-3-phosphate acyltransferase PlsY